MFKKYISETAFLFCLILFFLFPMQSFSEEIPFTVKKGEAKALFIQARTLSEKGQLQKAREIFKEVIALDRMCALAYMNLSQLSTSLKDQNLYLEKALMFTDHLSKGERLIIEAYNARVHNNSEKEGQLLDQLVKSYPDDKRAHALFGNYYTAYDKHNLSILEFKKALELDKNYAPVYNGLGYAYMSLEEYDQSEAAFKKYISLLPNEANAYDSIGDLFTKTGRHLMAIDYYRKALEINKEFSMSQKKIGNNLVSLGRYKDAREAYAKAKSISVSDNDKIMNQSLIARSWLFEGQFETAINEFENAIEMAKSAGLPELQSGLLISQSRIALENNKMDVAELSLKKCKKLIETSELPSYAAINLEKEILFSQSLVSARSRYFNEAAERFSNYKAIVDKSKNPKDKEEIYQLTGLIALERGDFDVAVRELKKGNQEDAYTLYYLGLAMQKSGKKEQANSIFKSVTELNENGFNYAIIHNDANSAISALATEN